MTAARAGVASLVGLGERGGAAWRGVVLHGAVWRGTARRGDDASKTRGVWPCSKGEKRESRSTAWFPVVREDTEREGWHGPFSFAPLVVGLARRAEGWLRPRNRIACSGLA